MDVVSRRSGWSKQGLGDGSSGSNETEAVSESENRSGWGKSVEDERRASPRWLHARDKIGNRQDVHWGGRLEEAMEQEASTELVLEIVGGR